MTSTFGSATIPSRVECYCEYPCDTRSKKPSHVLNRQEKPAKTGLGPVAIYDMRLVVTITRQNNVLSRSKNAM